MLNASFDRMYLVSGNGQTLEDISEYGLVNDTLIKLQQSNSVRKGTALQYGFSTADAISQCKVYHWPYLVVVQF